MRIIARNIRGRPSDLQGREPEFGNQRVARCPRVRRTPVHRQPLLLTAWISLILAALIACEPGIDTVDEYSETGSYGTAIDLPTMDEDVAVADPALLATRLDSLGSTVQENAESVAEASTVDTPVATTATPEPFRLALAELEADAESGEISLQSEGILDDLDLPPEAIPGIMLVLRPLGRAGILSAPRARTPGTP